MWVSCRNGQYLLSGTRGGFALGEKRVSVVFFIGNMSHGGGTERVLSVVANGLSGRGFHVSVMSLWGKGQSFFSLDNKVKLYWLEEKCGSFAPVRQLRVIAGILEREQADFLVDVDIILGFYSFLASRPRGRMHERRMRWISWEHFNYYYRFPRNHYLRKIVRNLAGRFSDCLIVLTEEDKGYYCRRLRPKCPVLRIYNPLPFEHIRKGQADEGGEKQAEKRMIFAAGRLTKVKGFDLLISSWEFLEFRYPDWKLVIAGDGEERQPLDKKVKRAGLKNIVFAGNVENIEDYYQKAAFFVLPSRWEGLPMVLIEAMSFSLPAVSYLCKTGPGEIITEGENGFLVEPGHVAEFAQKMEFLMRDEGLRRQMGEKAANSLGRFEPEKILDDWEHFLRIY